MAKKSLGHVELEWTCPNCDTKNPGPQKTCLSCGMPQPDDVKFEQRAQETLIEDEAKLAEAKAGPDIHCRYCGTRNPATATNCSQCGADLGEGEKRESGQVLGAHKDKPAEPIECSSCGTMNDADAPNCIQCGASLVDTKAVPEPAPPAPAPKKRGMSMPAKIGIVVLTLFACAACITGVIMFNRTEELTGTVKDVSWTRTIAIEQLKLVTHEDWQDEIPEVGTVGTCSQKVRRTQANPAPNSREVCGTPYTVDKGSGYGEVVQDCKYEVLEPYCEYTMDEWRMVNEVSAQGSNFSPHWPSARLINNQREGDREETYRCIFTTESGQYTYATSNPDKFALCEIGSKWVLKVNTFNMITDIEPK